MHFVAFYISNIAYRFYAEGYLDELFQVLKYNVFFSLLGSPLPRFMLDGVFSISRRGMIYFFPFQYVFRLCHGSLAQEIPEVCFTAAEEFAKDFLDHSDQSDGKGFDILHSPSLFHGELIGVTVMDDTDFAHSGVRVVQPDQMMNFVTKEVVDEVFINLPSEDYNISDLVSEFESMGIDVSVNLNAFNFASLWAINGFEKSGD